MDVNELNNLVRKVKNYQNILENTVQYRKDWTEWLQARIVENLEFMVQHSGLSAKVEVKEEVQNLSAVVLSLGEEKSGMYEVINSETHRHLIKANGSLIYQQLFNGKVMVMIQMPFIERYGKPQQPKTIAIYRPEELKDPYFVRHVESFISDITQWEDYDDDEDPNKRIGFDFNFGSLSEVEAEED